MKMSQQGNFPEAPDKSDYLSTGDVTRLNLENTCCHKSSEYSAFILNI